MIKSYSQASQDIFVSFMNGFKYNGTFLEIGANHPIQHNNSYLLESKYGWKGVLIEYDPSFSALYKTHRPNSIFYIGDARAAPVKSLLHQGNFPSKMDYLQLDLDVNNRSTLDTLLHLDQTVFDDYTFGTVTFEHDIYTGDFFNTRQQSREIFQKRGYNLMFPDVKVEWMGKHVAFEDWYAHPDIVSYDKIQKHKTTESLLHTQIANNLI